MTVKGRETGSALDDRALALMESAVEAIGRDDTRAAAAALEQAAELHAFASRPYDEARCLQLAATVRRAAGSTRTQALLDRAAGIAPRTGPLAISIHAERAESSFADRRYGDSVGSWTKAIIQAESAALAPAGMGALLRRRAAAFVALGQLKDAATDFERASRLTEQALGFETSRFVGLEHVDRLWHFGFTKEAELVLDELDEQMRDRSTSAHVDSDVRVWRARFARTRGDAAAALEHARAARSAALAAVAVTSYFAASVELAEAHRVRAEHADAYGALATAWASLSDVIGGETAQSWVEPCLAAYRVAWGDAAFQQARSEYESALRRQLTEAAV